MKKTLIVLGCMSLGLAHAQQIGDARSRVTSEKGQSRVGINTDRPVATLEVAKITNPTANQVEGFMLPHLTQAERNNMNKDDLANGLQIFNVSKNCIEWWNGVKWQCIDGTLSDDHGADFTPPKIVDATFSEAIRIYKNDCPAGQQAKATASKQFAQDEVVGRGEGVATTRAVAYEEALKKAKQDFYRQVQEVVNETFLGNQYCEAAPIVAPPTIPTVPENMEIGDGVYWWSSIYDNDYLNTDGTVSKAIGLATTEQRAAKGFTSGDEPVLDFQGIISTTPMEVFIPIKLTAGTSANLSDWSREIEIPAEYTEDNRKGVVRLNWAGGNVAEGTTHMRATIAAVGSEVKLKKLDLVNGQGGDQMGMVIGTFRFPKNRDEMADENNWTGKYELRLISGIPDRRFTTNTIIDNNGNVKQIHRHIYVPFKGLDGRIWLNFPLGAEYTNTRSRVFNPNTMAVNERDGNAFGYVPMWGREFDGHEVIVGETRPYIGVTNKNWVGTTYRPTNFFDNCPEGYHHVRYEEVKDFSSRIMNNSSVANRAFMGLRYGGRIAIAGVYSSINGQISTQYYWLSMGFSDEVGIFLSGNGGYLDKSGNVGNVRCIKN